jgi:putative membrane protein
VESSARDHLANERTFLAYLRTALAFVGFGFVVARFALFIREFAALEHTAVQPSTTSTAFGIVMVSAGMAIALFGLYRYVAVGRGLAQGRPSQLSPKAAAAVVAALVVFGIVLTYVLSRVPDLH